MPPRAPAITVCFLAASIACRADIADLLGPRTIARLQSAGALTRAATGPDNLLYLPRIPGRDAVVEGVRAVSPTVVIEQLVLTHFPGREMGAPESRLEIYNALRSLSRLEGLEYYSISQHAMRTLYTASYRVSSARDRRRLPDPLVSAVPDHDEVLVYQQDTTFGGNVYAVAYENAPSFVLMTISNLATMRYLLLPLVQPGGMELRFVVIPDGEHVLIYAVAAVNLQGPWARAGAVGQSFSHRVDAMCQRLSEILCPPGSPGASG